MRALSIMQPWLFAICRMGKRIENRTWSPPADLIGQRVALHAGAKEFTGLSLEFFLRAFKLRIEIPKDKGYQFGVGAGAASAIVAVATLRGVVASKEQAVELGQENWWADHTKNVGHLLDNVVELPEPVLGVKGALSYWRLSPQDEAKVAKQLQVVAQQASDSAWGS